MKKIGVIVGSLRKASWNRKVALALIKLAPSTLDMQIIEIDQLPVYNQDLDDEGNPPKQWTDFREQMRKFDGVLFAAPEYNRSIPAPLKNAIDVGSRPYGKSIWGGKPVAVISASPGSMGGFGANQHLRQTFVFLDMPCMQQPEAYLSGVDKLFDDKSNLTNENTQKFLRNFIEAYAKWVDKILR
jgi:chromate reductase